MIYINVGDICFIPMNVHHKLFNGVRQLRWKHILPVVTTFSTSIRLLSSLSSSFSLCQGWVAACNFFTASSDSLFHPLLSPVFFFQSPSSPAFFTSPLILLFHKALRPPSLFLSLSVHLSLSLSVVLHPVFLIIVVFPFRLEMLMFFLAIKSYLPLDTFTIQFTHPVIIFILMQ